MIPQPPSGNIYKTLDERCMACEVYGGEEKNCKGKLLHRYRETHPGRDCPREELQPGNVEALDLAMILMDEQRRPLAPFFAEELPPEERMAVLRRVNLAVGSRRVADALKAMRKTDEKAAE